MAGLDVSRSALDMKANEAVQAVREAFVKVNRIFFWLADNPVVNGVDPLVTEYAYTEDEAYLLRFVFGGLHDLNTTDLLTPARKLTGLE